nr:hypothetical protein [Tanacetum cinerariifolium]
MDDDMAPDAHVYSSDDEDIGNAHIPKNNWASALESTYLPHPEDSLLAQTGNMAMFMDWFCKRQGITELKPQDLEGPAFELVKVFHPNVIHLQCQMEECHKLLTDSMGDSTIRHNVSKQLPLGGPPGQVTIQSNFFFNKDLEYLRYGSKGSRPALSISKMKATYYRDVGLEKMVLDQTWIEEEYKYDISTMYGFNSLVHSFYALSTLRRFDLRTASAAAKPYQGDSSELYLIKGGGGKKKKKKDDTIVNQNSGIIDQNGPDVTDHNVTDNARSNLNDQNFNEVTDTDLHTSTAGQNATSPVQSSIPNEITTGFNLVPTSPRSMEANLYKLEVNVPKDADYDGWLPLASVHEEKYGLKKVTMPKDFFFFKFLSTEGVYSVLRNSPWMICEIFSFLNKWLPSVILIKDDLSYVPVLVKFHDVPLVAYTSNRLSLIATKISTPMMLNSYTNSMYLESLGRSSYARVLIEINACNDFNDNFLMSALNLE